MSDSKDWLDAQTKAQLQKSPPDKLAPPIVDGYSLVLLERGTDREWVYKTIEALVEDANRVTSKCPFVVRRQLSLADALQGQFELICTDSISVFVDDNIIRKAQASYLHELFQTVRQSTEFEPTKIHLRSVPANEDGRQLLRQFFGLVLGVPITHIVTRKKARLLAHWGSKLGATIEIDA